MMTGRFLRCWAATRVPPLPRKMKNLVMILAILVPCPGLGYVIVVFEVHDELVFMAGLRGWQIAGTHEGEHQLCQRAARNRFHSWLIVGRTVMHQGDPVSVETIKGHHRRHARRAERLHNHRARDTGLKYRSSSHIMLVLPLPLSG